MGKSDIVATQDPDSLLGKICRQVALLEVGQRLNVDARLLRDATHSMYHNGVEFTPADRVLENIVGSAFTHSYQVQPCGTVTFFRHERKHGARYYTSPDRR